MPIIKPVEMSAGVPHSQAVAGRVCMLEISKQGLHDCARLHLVVDAVMSGTLYIEAWRYQARRLHHTARERKLLTLTNLTINVMGDKAQWQCTALDVHGSAVAATRMAVVH